MTFRQITRSILEGIKIGIHWVLTAQWMRRLQIDILTSFVFILTIAFGLIIVFYNFRINEGILELATNLIDDVSAKNIYNVQDLLKSMEDNVKVGQAIIQKPNDIGLQNTVQNEFLSQMILQNPPMQTLSFANIEGNMVQCYRTDKNHRYLTDKTRPVPDGTAYALREVHRTDPMFETWAYYNESAVELARETANTTKYDPRTRDWFTAGAANKTFDWSPMYYSFTAKLISFAASQPLFDDKNQFFGIAATSSRIGVVSEFMEAHPFGKNGIQLLIDDKGYIIAMPGVEVQKKVEEAQRPISLDDLGDPVILAAYSFYQENPLSKFIFKVDGVEWLVSFTPLDYGTLHWALILLAPTSDYLGPLLKTQKQVIYVCSVVIFLSILLSIFTSKRISRPIIKLTYEIEKIRQFDLASDIDIVSNIKEVRMITDALKSMKNTLRAFGYYVPKQIVNRLLETGERVQLGGKTETLTLFFSDIYNFTTISEKMAPEALMTHLSEYLDALSQIIIQNKGTIDKYTGDNIMAFWGAPVEIADHAAWGCRTALLCQYHLNRINHKWQYEGKPTFETRIGLHSGEAVVGNIGTSERLNYTAIGDSVNIASRLEGLNKAYHTKILISEDTRKKIGETFLCRPLDIVAVKGKEKGIKVYELFGEYKNVVDILPERAHETLAKEFTKGFDLYIEKKFAEAQQIFKDLLKDYPSDYATQIYIERCGQYIKTPPPSDWDGTSRFAYLESPKVEMKKDYPMTIDNLPKSVDSPLLPSPKPPSAVAPKDLPKPPSENPPSDEKGS